jgi:hypothetical protein
LSATLSEDGLYRYDLVRHTNVLGAPQTSTVVFVGLNPSTADANTDDPTVRRCVGYARRWQVARMVLVNLFAYRTKDPGLLAGAKLRGVDIIGPDNDMWLRAWCDGRYPVVAAWGGIAGQYQLRAAHVLGMVQGREGAPAAVYCLGTTKAGHPRHPLYMRADAPLQRLV